MLSNGKLFSIVTAVMHWKTVRSTCSHGNSAIGVEAHRALMSDISYPRALILNFGHGQCQLDVYDMAIYIFFATESVICVREPCLLCRWSSSVAQLSAGTVPWLPSSSDIITLVERCSCFTRSIYPQIGVITRTLL